MRTRLISIILTVIMLSNVVLADTNVPSKDSVDNNSNEYYEDLMNEYNRIAAEYGCTITVANEDIEEFCSKVTEEKLREALSQLEPVTDDFTLIEEEGPRTSHTWTCSSPIGTGVTLVAYITGTYNHNRVTSCTNVTSTATGLTLGDTYYQTSYTYSIATGGTSMTVHVYGKYNVNIIIEGIGTIATIDIHKTFTVTAP